MKKNRNHFCTLLLVQVFFAFSAYSQTVIFPFGSSWKYLDNGSNQGTAWRTVGFNDASWSVGNSELGYGDGDEATVVSYGPNSSNKYITTYFRKTINIPDPSIYTNFTFTVLHDDGSVVYVNGVEVGRSNMPGGTPSYTTLASSAVEDPTYTFNVANTAFVPGNNVIAIEVHQSSASSTDISLNVELRGNDPFSATLVRGPYLQMGSQTGITIRWRTSSAQDSRVELGTSFGTYPIVVTDPASVTEHIVRVTGLDPDTKYWYRIGNSTHMGTADPDKFFTTVPPPNTERKIKIIAFGDCGRGNATYQDENLSNYRNFLTANGIDAPDAWILLGDNAYNSGTDAEYTNNFFGVYGSNLLKNHKLYPAPGNHDYANNAGNKTSRSMPYYNVFSTPQNGECGGEPSGKPNFYSFDIGNIHFLSLDSWGIETNGTHMGSSAASTTLKEWLDADLAANTQKWTVAYWHHPPYTKSSHNSDSETELVNIRQNFITFLEQRGVDLIICGHSHAYERGYLLRNFTGSWTSFTPATHAVSTSSGAYTSASSCPYVYNSTPLNHGAVYVVAGSTGASGGVQTGFASNAMPFSVNDGGVLYFEVEDNRLDAKMLRRNGTIFDQFTIMKDVNRTSTVNIFNGQSATLEASWPGSGPYTWSNSQVGRSISVSPPVGSHNFTVTDEFGCVMDQFTVNVSTSLPVNLAKYEVKLDKGKVYINWSTTSETNSRNFTVERSVDGVTFKPIAVVEAAGNSSTLKNYSVTDRQPLKGTSYYRLKQDDIDGQTRYYETKKIVLTEGYNFDMKVTTKSEGLLVSLESAQKAKVTLKVYDISGRLLQTHDWKLETGMNTKQLTAPKGTYLIYLIAHNGDKTVQKVIIQ